MTSTQEAFKLLADAEDYLRYAGDNRRIGIHGPAVSLAYYAAFYAAQAVIAYHREGAKTHRGVLRRFGYLAVVSSDFPADIAELLTGLMENRLVADYDHDKMGTWNEREASDAIERATTFVRAVSDWFGRRIRPEGH